MPRTIARQESGVYVFINENLLPEKLREMASSLLNNKDPVRMVLGLPQKDQARFVDRADQALPVVDADNAGSVASLGNICSASGCLPSSALLSAGLEKRGSTPAISTGLIEIWRGEHGHRPVSIEVFHSCTPQLLEELKEILFKRVPTLKRLSHLNILPFRGVNMTLFPLALVYDWGENGTIIEYAASHPDASRMALLSGVAKGLQRLHSLDIPHGDLRGNNVHVDGSGNACLTEYGLGNIKRNPRLTVAVTPGAVEGVLAPELIHVTSTSALESKLADVFSFGMLAFELLTGTPPFDGQSPARAAFLISQGTRPEFPVDAEDGGLTTQVQDFLRRCWHSNPMERPTIDEVVRTLELFDTNEKPQATIHKSPNIHCSIAEVQVQPTIPTIKGRKSRKRRRFCGLI